MNRKDFLKRLGLLSTTAIAAPAILAEQSQIATTKSVEQSQIATTKSVERMRFHNDGRVTVRDKCGFLSSTDWNAFNSNEKK
jgi:hypothetical protein